MFLFLLVHLFRFLPKMAFDVRFTFNRFPIRNMHRAVDIIGREAGQFWWNMLFPEKKASTRKLTSKVIPSFYNKKIEENAEQRLAVKFCLDFTSYSFNHVLSRNYKQSIFMLILRLKKLSTVEFLDYPT